MQKETDDIYLLVFIGMAGCLLLCLGIILFYIRYQKKLYRQREEMQQAELSHQVQLLHSTIQSQEDERRRIGRDLHDEVGGSLANLRMAISNIANAPTQDILHDGVTTCRALTDTMINTVRHISHNLSPSGMDIFGLATVLEDLCDRTSRACGLNIILKNNADKLLQSLPINTSIALYRVVQELLTNTIKHANARQIKVQLSGNTGKLTLDYADDGKGVSPAGMKSMGMGMHNIESRLSMVYGTYNITTAMGEGFKIHIEVPA